MKEPSMGTQTKMNNRTNTVTGNTPPNFRWPPLNGIAATAAAGIFFGRE
jgi:hypothetical protein